MLLGPREETGEEPVRGFVTTADRSATAGLFGLALLLGIVPAFGQGASPQSWLDPTLLAAAKSEGSVVVYTSTNEQEGLPLFKIFEDATGLKVNYVRGTDTLLMSRMAIEMRAGQSSFDIVFSSAAHKLPSQALAEYVPPQASAIAPDARDPSKRWHGVYANYNAPAYNTHKVQAGELPKSYEEFAKRPDWAGKVAIDGTDVEWLKAMFQFYGEPKATQLIRDIVATVKPVVTDGHLALARSVAAGEYWISLNNYVMLSTNVKVAGGPVEIFPLDPVALFFSEVGINAKAPHPNAARLAANFMLSQECQQFLSKFGRLPTRQDVASNPPGVIELLTTKKVVTTLFKPEEEKKWQQTFAALFKPR
jgi:iron(III) transport system substrate-binding protein